MKIYKDKAQDTAIVTCTIEELRKMETAFFFAVRHFQNLANSENESWKADLDLDVAFNYAELHKLLAKATEEEKIAEQEEIRQEVLKLKNEK